MTNQSPAVSGAELRPEVESIERMMAERKDISEAINEKFADLKSRGYPTGPLRQVIADRQKSPDDVSERDAHIEMFKDALEGK